MTELITQDEHIIYNFQAKKLNFLKEIGDFWYFHIYSGQLFCESLCRSAANHFNATKERKVFVKFYFYHDTSHFPLLWMFEIVKSVSKVIRKNIQWQNDKIRKS